MKRFCDWFGVPPLMLIVWCILSLAAGAIIKHGREGDMYLAGIFFLLLPAYVGVKAGDNGRSFADRFAQLFIATILMGVLSAVGGGLGGALMAWWRSAR